ncbi:helix-turn-helix domain-containing protein [Hahella aquimaris]|uniref:helix-turn-helix domain-containing protein n=1 Tax=Hahella sp. HNIBRBA332 TaxID=3015983 RepID=UPI00273B86F8|nr:helix-turn-helix domain-containing protein [Hahella sp. HNIBRBA332]WLQ13923.1 helix-turn-helix domain-containing protein [Hahella sp. HNIBRBA332]
MKSPSIHDRHDANTRTDASGVVSFHFGEPEIMEGSHQHCHLEINILLSGAMRLSYLDQLYELESGDVICFSALHRHQLISADENALLLQLRLPLFLLTDMCANEMFKHLLIRGTPYRSNATDLLSLDAVERWVQELRCLDGPLQDLVLDEITLFLRRMIMRNPCKSGQGSGCGEYRSRHLHHAHCMVEFINSNYRTPITIADVADGVGLHKNFAMSVFKKAVGMSVLEYLTDLRVNHARRLLLYSQDQVIEIAFASGFSSVTRFYEVFAKYFNESPLKYRKQHADPG